VYVEFEIINEYVSSKVSR